MENEEIYLDNASTVKPSEEVIRVIDDVLHDSWYNSSGLYYQSVQSHKLLDDARKTVADSINAEPDEIVFTSGGSESNSLAIKGFLAANGDYSLITDGLSHSSVRDMDIPKDIVLNSKSGMINIKSLFYRCSRLRTKKKPAKPFVSVVGANNEIGTIQNIEQISRIVHNADGVLHIDAVQLYPDQRIDVKRLKIDLMSVSGHKFGCPSGIGFLYVRNGIKLSPLISGEQERGLRGGTENLAYVCGMAKAVELWNYGNREYVAELRDYFIGRLMEIGEAEIVGSLESRLANNVNVRFNTVDGQSLLMYLDNYGICCSNGSACNSFSYEPSAVLKALGYSDEEALECVRFTLPYNLFSRYEISNKAIVENYMNGYRKQLDRVAKLIERYITEHRGDESDEG